MNIIDINRTTSTNELVKLLGLDPEETYCWEIIDSCGRSITTVSSGQRALAAPFWDYKFAIKVGPPCEWPYKVTQEKTRAIFNVTDWTTEDDQFMADSWCGFKSTGSTTPN